MNPKAWAIAIVALAGVSAIEAHHSISMFELATPIWVRGTVVSYEPVNPHAVIVLEETTEGAVRRWWIEGPSLRRISQMELGADFIRPGDVIEACGFPPKAEFTSRQPAASSRVYQPQAIHGHVLLLPDGHMQPWGSYGKLENCIRPDDRTQTWVDFVNADPMARGAWCRSRTFVSFESLPPQAFIDEVDSLMENPCE